MKEEIIIIEKLEMDEMKSVAGGTIAQALEARATDVNT